MYCRRSLASCLFGAAGKADRFTFTTAARRASNAFSTTSGFSPEATLSESNTAAVCSSKAETLDKTAQWSAALPDIPYGFPEGDSTAFAAERSGGLKKRWLQNIAWKAGNPQGDTLLVQHYLPNKDDFWRSPPYEALREVVLHSPYHDALKIIMEHDYRFLFADVMCNVEAPMPHVIYEDFMKCLTFSSRQQPPEEQFALPEPVLRDILCSAGYYCTLDRFFFTSASMLFHKVEQEQHMSPALHSAWIYICTAAGKLDEALAYASYMEAHNIPFDADIFARMLHPSLTPAQQHLQHAPQTSRGIVLQRRLCQDMNQHHGTLPVAVHAMFVYHVLTLQHTRKWEVLRKAAELFNRRRQQENNRSGVGSPAPFTSAAVSAAASSREVICSRTMQLAMSFFCREKGVRWGPHTTTEMLKVMLGSEEAGSTVADVVFVLMRTRRNERTEILSALPKTAFSEDEQEALMHTVYHRARRDPAYAVAGPLLQELLAADGSTRTTADGGSAGGSNEGIDRAIRHLQKLASLATSCDVTDSTPTSSALQAAGAGAPREGEQTSSTPTALHGTAVDGRRCGLTSLSWTMAQTPEEEVTPSTPEIARDLLAAVMALDCESVAAPQTVIKTSVDQKTSFDESVDKNASLAVAEEDRLRELYVSLEKIGTSSSLSAWSLQQLQKEEEEERLQRHAANAWISPAYVPQ
ncbi:hypothetical protein JKF63_05967 [Porcisia hertigi]|uniref:Uncharacterized protein n=1 Tax=Porcisia hertigi TaxID=2761500 RepID=A0A836LC43_9TRYP|nr:hypothetical protein JKF63_05967 [Porcisia hertigi]